MSPPRIPDPDKGVNEIGWRPSECYPREPWGKRSFFVSTATISDRGFYDHMHKLVSMGKRRKRWRHISYLSFPSPQGQASVGSNSRERASQLSPSSIPQWTFRFEKGKSLDLRVVAGHSRYYDSLPLLRKYSPPPGLDFIQSRRPKSHRRFDRATTPKISSALLETR